MEYVIAFIVCGLLCAVFQTVMSITKLAPPFMLIFTLAIGGALATTGIFPWLQSVCGGGLTITVLGAGAAIMVGLSSLFCGQPLTIIVLIIVFILLAVIGIISGTIYMKIHPEKETGE